MKKIIIYILFCFFISGISGQNIELSGGMNRNNYFDWQKEEGHFIAEYTPGNGYCAELSLSDFKFDSLTIKISLLVDNYKGSFYTQDGGLAGAYKTVAEVEKTTLGIGLYPLNFYIFKKIKLSLGGELSYKISDRTNGYKSGWVMYVGSTYMTIENDSVHINKDFVWGVSGKLSYDFRINQDWFIAPQYKFYLGMSDEFMNTEARIRSMRHNFEISIIKRINL
ncbi:MAG: hypothetical protein WCI92_14860 [Bacteroidota bacterium]